MKQALRVALDLALDQNGFVTFTDLTEAGIDPALARQWLRRGRVERVAHGVYRFPEVPPSDLDAYMLATLWAAGRGVLSHETALQLHGLCDIEPALIHITVPPTYWPRRGGGERYRVHLEQLGDDEVEWFEGMRIVTPLCAIRQAIATAVPPHLVGQAIEVARRRGRVGEAEAKALDAALRGSK
ncbi:MAG: type IV toxin-antitoxin system AbiEi family antitoxin domain-containing protein [Acidimicrobiia bacterium]